MARVYTPTRRQEKGWKKWLASRPEKVRALGERFDPWSLYRIKETGQRCMVTSFFEDGTVKVSVTGEYNVVMFDTEVFGIDPDSLEPCDPPAPDEEVGAVYTEDKDIEAYVNSVRPLILAARKRDGTL